MGKLTKEVSLWIPDKRTPELVYLIENYCLRSVVWERLSQRGWASVWLGVGALEAPLVMLCLSASGDAMGTLSLPELLGQLRCGVEAAHIELSLRGWKFFIQ